MAETMETGSIMQNDAHTLSFENPALGAETQNRGNPGRERRAAARQPQQRTVKLTDMQGLRYWGGQTVDVSDSGLLLALDGPALPVGSTVRVAVAWGGQGFLRESDLVPARVVRCLRSPSGQFMVALELKVASDSVRQAA